MKRQGLRLDLLVVVVMVVVWLLGPAAGLHCNVCVSQVVPVMVPVMVFISLATAGWSGRFLCQQ